MIDKAYLRKMRVAAKQSVTVFNRETRNRTVVRSERGGEEPPYNGATFLYIRGYDGDQGVRPVPPNTIFWLSPDIELFDSGGVRITTTDIKSGAPYTVEVTVTNDGDADCHSCLVELFLDDPSIGFNITASQPLGSAMVAVPRKSKAAVQFPFTATASMSGHRCMFARASSLITNDIPADWIGFNACLDRHLGQQNLEIVQQGTKFEFKIHLQTAFQNKGLALTLQPNAKVADMVHLPAIGRYLVAGRTTAPPEISIARLVKPAPAAKGARRGAASAAAATGISLKREVKSRWAFKSKSARETMRIDIPQLGLRPNEMLPMDLWLTDPASGQVVGGITLLVVG